MRNILIKIWNFKVLGLPKAIYLTLRIITLNIIERANGFFWRLNFKECSENVIVQIGTSIRYPGNITLKKNIAIGRDCILFSEFSDSTLYIGSGSQINSNCSIDFSGDLAIHERVLISEGVNIMTHDHGYDPFSKPKKCSLVINDNAWIGAHAIILPQVDYIGKNAIIASGAVVTKNVEDNMIVGGNPAKIIKSRI